MEAILLMALFLNRAGTQAIYRQNHHVVTCELPPLPPKTESNSRESERSLQKITAPSYLQ
jgi:hypothetical protein